MGCPYQQRRSEGVVFEMTRKFQISARSVICYSIEIYITHNTFFLEKRQINCYSFGKQYHIVGIKKKLERFCGKMK